MTSVIGLEAEARKSSGDSFDPFNPYPRLWPVSVENAINLFLATALFGELLVVFANIVARSLFHYSFPWATEASQIALTILTFIGGAAAYGSGMHLSMRFVVNRLPLRWRGPLDDFKESAVLVTSFATLMLSLHLLKEGWDVRTPILQIRDTWLALPVSIGFAMICGYSGCNLMRRRTRSTVSVLAAVVGLAGAVTVAKVWLGPVLSNQSVAGVSLFVFAVLLLAAVPIAFVLLASPIFALGVTGLAYPTVVPLTMRDGTNNFILLAIPFFVLAGLVLAEGGASSRIADLVERLVGRIRGGLLQVVIVSMYLFSGLSGSKAADMAAVGAPLTPVMEKHGHRREEIAAVLAASAVMGETIPPSLAMIVLSSITTVSVAALFIAGLLPAVLLAACLMATAYLRTQAAGSLVNEGGWQRTGRVAMRATPALVLPAILVIGIGGGIATPTEVSSFAVIYGVLLSGLAYRMPDSAFWRSVKSSTSLAGLILFIVTAASAFSWVINVGGLPDRISALVLSLSGYPWLFMVASIAALIVLGALLEGLPALLIFAPLLLPAAARLGISPLQYALVLIISMGIGTHLPLIGVGVYVASTITKASVEDITKPLLIYLSVLLVGLGLLAALPQFSLVLPRLLGLSAR
ncbi:MAG TPA: TRAP transporter large permease subunit [bacterium]|nr:TRAP transporter large permease subunit [bacterium]